MLSSCCCRTQESNKPLSIPSALKSVRRKSSSFYRSRSEILEHRYRPWISGGPSLQAKLVTSGWPVRRARTGSEIEQAEIRQASGCDRRSSEPDSKVHVG